MGEMDKGTGARVKEQAENLGDTVQMQAVEVKEKGREELRTQLDERTTQVGSQARAFAQTLRRSAQETPRQNGENQAVARVSETVADGIERAGGYLERARGEEMLRDAERFARERPWVVAGVAAAAGFAASRLLKASSERRYGAYGEDGGNRYRYGDTIESTRYAGAGSAPAR